MTEKIVIHSQKTNKYYTIYNIKSYRIEQAMEIASDAFEFIIGNQNYEASDVISSGDKVQFYLEGELAIEGYIDDVDIEYNNNSNDLRITGRDEIATILDNDSIPVTYNKIGLKDYLGKKMPSYGIKYYCSDNTKFDKITVSPGDSEFSVIEQLANERNLIIMYNISEQKLYVTKPISSTTPTYTFSNTLKNKIKILDCQISISNDIRNEITVYGGTYSEKHHTTIKVKGQTKKKTVSVSKNIKATYKDSSLKTKKRKIITESDIKKTNIAYNRAKQEFYNLNKNALTVQIKTRTKSPIYINKCARIVIPKIEFDAYLLVDSVTYTKDISEGNITNITLKLMPDVKVTFKNNDIPKLPKL
jgi:prophage tail gpP-like protein